MGVAVGSTGRPVPQLNLALGCRYPAGTPEQVIDEEIDQIKAFFTERGVPWYWWIGANPAPSDIAKRLERHGLELRSALPSMAAPLPARSVSLNPAAHVWVASSRSDLEAASVIRSRAFRFPPGAADHYFEDMSEDWLRGDPARLYLARLEDGPPASIAARILECGLPGVYVMATLPEFGRRGLAKAILTRLLADAEAEGHGMAVLTASDLGYRLYTQFGFEHLFDYLIYRPSAGSKEREGADKVE
jgi:GNAT superfamily N-acetyltransferase